MSDNTRVALVEIKTLSRALELASVWLADCENCPPKNVRAARTVKSPATTAGGATCWRRQDRKGTKDELEINSVFRNRGGRREI